MRGSLRIVGIGRALGTDTELRRLAVSDGGDKSKLKKDSDGDGIADEDEIDLRTVYINDAERNAPFKFG